LIKTEIKLEIIRKQEKNNIFQILKSKTNKKKPKKQLEYFKKSCIILIDGALF